MKRPEHTGTICQMCFTACKTLIYYSSPTYSITLPATTPLPKAAAVHHVAFLMQFGEGLVHLICETIHDTLVYRRH